MHDDHPGSPHIHTRIECRDPATHPHADPIVERCPVGTAGRDTSTRGSNMWGSAHTHIRTSNVGTRASLRMRERAEGAVASNANSS